METTHRFLLGDARSLPLEDASVHLVVTSPPYPMIAMWDAVFEAMDPTCRVEGDGRATFEAMHRQLDRVWAECHRVLVPGGLLCVNIGDATRSLDGDFRIYPNHARILAGARGFDVLPDILWRKPNNSPTKFMGSGMLPGGAYVTYEHEYVLILRKGGKRRFSPAEAARRRRSAYFWEERNRWFSDLWELTGTRQASDKVRERTAAFPLALPWRLTQMFSCYGERVLDPFVGTGTTMLAAMISGRSSVGVDAERLLGPLDPVKPGQELTRARLATQRAFVAERSPAHHNAGLDLPVVTRQEKELELWEPVAVSGAQRDGGLSGGEDLWRVRYQRLRSGS